MNSVCLGQGLQNHNSKVICTLCVSHIFSVLSLDLLLSPDFHGKILPFYHTLTSSYSRRAILECFHVTSGAPGVPDSHQGRKALLACILLTIDLKKKISFFSILTNVSRNCQGSEVGADPPAVSPAPLAQPCPVLNEEEVEDASVHVCCQPAVGDHNLLQSWRILPPAAS